MNSKSWLGISLVLMAMFGLSLTGVGFVFGQIDNSIIGAGMMNTANFLGESITGSEPYIFHHGYETSQTRFFYGHGVFQVIIEDPERNSASGDEIRVEIEARRDSDNTLSFIVPDTHEGSARFEFFLIHKDSLLDIDSLKPDNVDLAVGMSGAGPRAAPIVTFGSGGDLDTHSDIFDELELLISYNDLNYDIHYERTDGEILVDRTQYGSDSLVFLRIADQDANLNPTVNDIFDVEMEDIALLFDASGATFRDGLTFKETNIDSGLFEARLTLTNDIAKEDPSDIADPQVDFLERESESIIIQLFDKSNYSQDINNDSVIDVALDDPEINSSGASSEVIFQIKDEDGELELPSLLSFPSELQLTLIDSDQNKNSEVVDELNDVISVEIDGAGADKATVGVKETEDSSGIFELDLRNHELPITFCSDSDSRCPDTSNSILEFREQDIGEDIVVFYKDSHGDEGAEATIRRTSQLTTTIGRPSIKPILNIANKVMVSIYDPDLNDNPRTAESYSFTLLGTDPVPLKRAGGETIGMIAELEVLLDGTTPNYDGSRTFTFRETDIDTGNFTMEITSEEYQAIAHLPDPLGDQEIFELIYHDNMEDPDRESITEYQTGKRISPVMFSRTVVPIPATDIDRDGAIDPPTIVWRIIDPAFNHYPTTEDIIPVRGTFFKIVMTSEDGDDVIILDRSTNRMSDIFANPPTELRETGPNTAFFTADLSFHMGGEFDEIKDWDHATLEIIFIEDSVFLDNDSNNSARLTFSGQDGNLLINQTRIEIGDILYIAVNDNDLNLDDTVAEEFRSSREPAGDYLLAIETKDDNVCDKIDKCPSIKTFRETGPNTGIFLARFKIGTDITVSGYADNDLVQASRILVTYNDQIASGNGEAIERELRVITGTGRISVQPELVGPTTRLDIAIIDPDLNRNPSAADRYDPERDSNFVTIRTDRREVGKAIPKLIETSPDSNEFVFSIDLVTDEVACGKDHLDSPEFEVQGGDNPSVGVCPGDILLIEYEDEMDAAGRKALSTVEIPIESFDPILVVEKSTYFIGDKIMTTIFDPDANRNPDVSDTLTGVRAVSDIDPVGIELSGREAGRNTGVFVMSFSTSSLVKERSVQVEAGKNVTVVYEDKFPAEFANSETERQFSFDIPIMGRKTVIPAALALSDNDGNVIDKLVVGKQVTLVAQIVSNSTEAQQFFAVIEIRDKIGITMFLGWQSGASDSELRSSIGLSWVPGMAGTYFVRTFVISSMNKPQVLSEVLETQIQVL